MYDFSYNGHWLSEIKGLTAKRPPVEIAQRDFKIIDIAGKSGSDYVDLGRYKNVSMTREINFGYSEIYDSIPYRLGEWLLSDSGYHEYEDIDHPGMVAYAAVESLSEIEKKLGRIYRTTLKMNRKPFWYSRDGLIYRYNEDSNNTTNRSVTFVNPYAFPAQPLVKLTLSNSALTDSGNLNYTHWYYKDPSSSTYTSKTLYLKGLQGTIGSYNYVIIDFAEGTIKEFDSSGTFVQFVTVPSNQVPLNQFEIPAFTKINARISAYTGNCAKLEIMPRWRTL